MQILIRSNFQKLNAVRLQLQLVHNKKQQLLSPVKLRFNRGKHYYCGIAAQPNKTPVKSNAIHTKQCGFDAFQFTADTLELVRAESRLSAVKIHRIHKRSSASPYGFDSNVNQRHTRWSLCATVLKLDIFAATTLHCRVAMKNVAQTTTG